MKLSPPISPPTLPPLSAPPPYLWVLHPVRKGTAFLYSKLVKGSARLRAQRCKNNNNNISEAPLGLWNVFSLSSSSLIVLVQPSSDRFNTLLRPLQVSSFTIIPYRPLCSRVHNARGQMHHIGLHFVARCHRWRRPPERGSATETGAGGIPVILQSGPGDEPPQNVKN